MNTKIFICCHKDYEDVGITNPAYTLISDNEIKNNSSLELIYTDKKLNDKLFSELSKHYFVWKKLSSKYDNIGMCHYRRYFNFMNDIPDDTTLILPNPIQQPYNNVAMYSIYHNVEDIMNIANIIREKYPQYNNAFTNMLDSHYLIPYNMFIMRKDLYEEYMDFLFGVLFTYMEITGINNSTELGSKYIIDNSIKYLKTFSPNNTVEYQMRSIFGCTAERISTAFFNYLINEKHITTFKYIPTKVTNFTYNKI